MLFILCWKWGLLMFSLKRSPRGGWGQSVGSFRFIDLHNLPYFYVFHVFVSTTVAWSSFKHDHCRLLREKHNDKVSVLNLNKFVPILAHGVSSGFNGFCGLVWLLVYPPSSLGQAATVIIFLQGCGIFSEAQNNDDNQTVWSNNFLQYVPLLPYRDLFSLLQNR